MRENMHRYDIDAIYDSGMAQHLMENWYSPFPTFQSTTRPDKVAAVLRKAEWQSYLTIRRR